MKTLDRQLVQYGDEVEFLTRQQLMKLFNISKWRTEVACKDETDPIPHVKRGNTLRFPKQACIAWFNQQSPSA